MINDSINILPKNSQILNSNIQYSIHIKCLKYLLEIFITIQKSNLKTCG